MNRLTKTELEKLKVIRVPGVPAVPEISTNAYQFYCKDVVAPEGFEFTGEYRQGLKNETVLGSDGRPWNGEELSARLILRKVEPKPFVPNVTKTSFVFKYLGFVAPKVGQFFDTFGNGNRLEKATINYMAPYNTYEKVEI